MVKSFQTTQWSLILRIRSSDRKEAQSALDLLCNSYWQPIYAWIRSSGRKPDDARELTQSFFAWAIEVDLFAKADESRGRLRNFLLKSLKNFLKSEWNRASAKKRGGGVLPLSLDYIQTKAGENAYYDLAARGEIDSGYFDRHWARALLSRSIFQLRKEYKKKSKLIFFETFFPLLSEDSPSIHYADAGARLGLDNNAIRVAFHRFKKKYRDAVRQEVSRTLLPGEDIDSEIRYLFSIATDAGSHTEHGLSEVRS